VSSAVAEMLANKSYGDRKFYSLPEDYAVKTSKSKNAQNRKSEDTATLIKYIDENVIGKNTTFCGPFGRRKGKKALLYLLSCGYHFAQAYRKSTSYLCFAVCSMSMISLTAVDAGQEIL